MIQTTKLYKVLYQDRSCHGDQARWPKPNWSSPVPDRMFKPSWPGGWTEEIRHTGTGDQTGLYHLTSVPYRYYRVGCALYEAEGQGLVIQDKLESWWSQARLLRPVQHPDWWFDALDFIDQVQLTLARMPDRKFEPAALGLDQHRPYHHARAARLAIRHHRRGAQTAVTRKIWRIYRDLPDLSSSYESRQCKDPAREFFHDAALMASALVVQDLAPGLLEYARAGWLCWDRSDLQTDRPRLKNRQARTS